MSAAWRLVRGREGQALVELALVLPVLLLILLATVELGRAFDLTHALAGLTREGANLASRGTDLDEVLEVMLLNGTDIGLDANGGVIATHVLVEDDTARVEEQNASAGYELRSRIGQPGMVAEELLGIPLVNGQSLYVVEVFYPYEPVTPLHGFITWTLADELYERAIF